MRRALPCLLLFWACATAPPPNVDDDTRTTIEQLRNAVAQNPTNGARIYILAQYLDKAGESAETLRWLHELDRLGWSHGVNDHDFSHSVSRRDYRAIAARLNQRAPHFVRSAPAFTIPQPDLVPEGIAYDSATGDFYVSSIHLRKIVRVTPDGKSSDFIREGQDGIYGTLGMRVDAERRLLWVVSNASAEMNGFTDAMEGKSAIYAYDLRTGALATKAGADTSGGPTLLNDLVILDDGSVLVTDTDLGSIVRVRLGGDSIETWIPPGTFAFPNGIAIAPGEPWLFVADFRGVSRVDLRSRTVTPLKTPDGETLAGIDGMYFVNGSLVGIQNGMGAPRVIRVRLDDERDQIRSIEVLEAGNPQFDEPTTGAIANGALFFMANPQLRAFDENHQIWPRARLRDVVVLRLPLD